tara:strand:- start:25617 stop:26351 length:735 start_codon:yes stop_codon:yes gene_type:complete
LKVLILSAGKGSRLKLKLPKSLVEIDNRNMLEIQIEQLRLAGIDSNDITVITGYKKYLFKQYDLMTVDNKNYGSTGQVESISRGSHYSNEKEVVVIYGDILFEAKIIQDLMLLKSNFVVPSFKHFRELWQDRGDNNFDDLETFIQDKNNNILEIGNKIIDIDSTNGQFMGILYFNNYMFSNFLNWYKEYKDIHNKKSSNKIQTTPFLNYLICNNINIKTLNYEGYFRELDNETDLELIRESIIL